MSNIDLTNYSNCVWTEDEDGLWHTSCHEIFEIHEGTPDENSMTFCPYCGKELREERYEYHEEDV